MKNPYDDPSTEELVDVLVLLSKEISHRSPEEIRSRLLKGDKAAVSAVMNILKVTLHLGYELDGARDREKEEGNKWKLN
jgi:hypothetical protein